MRMADSSGPTLEPPFPLRAGAAFGDLNNDGAMDVVMNVLGGPPEIFYNRESGPHWLTLTLIGTRSNRDGIGARVVVNGQTQNVTTAGSYLSASDKRVHFGLGAVKSASVDVFWPSGVHQSLKDVKADQFLKVREPRQP